MRLRPIAGAAGSEGQRCSSDLSIEPEALADFCTSKERPQMSIVDRLAPQAHFIAGTLELAQDKKSSNSIALQTTAPNPSGLHHNKP